MVALLQGVIRWLASKWGVPSWAVILPSAAYVGRDVLDDIKSALSEHLSTIIKDKSGLLVDPARILGEPDAALSAAISDRAGFQVRSILDTDMLVKDLTVPVAQAIEQKSGLLLTDMTSEQQIQADVGAFGTALVQQHTGIMLSDIFDREAIERDVRAHLEDKFTTIVADRLTAAAADFRATDATIEHLLSMTKNAMDGTEVELKYRVREVGLGTAAAVVLATYAALGDDVVIRQVRRFRRQEQNRAAQRRFRERHGSRMKYQKLNP